MVLTGLPCRKAIVLGKQMNRKEAEKHIGKSVYLKLFDKAKEYVMDDPYYSKEVEYVKQRTFKAQTAQSFFIEYVFVVLSAGMKNQVVEKIMHRYFANGPSGETNIKAINHKGKHKAIKEAEMHYREWWEQLLRIEPLSERLEFLDSLPFVGPITKYHLARNLGIDVAKPDRHMKRLAHKIGCKDVQRMCEMIAKARDERVGVVDVILWRYINLLGWNTVSKEIETQVLTV